MTTDGDGLLFKDYDPRRQFKMPAPTVGIFDTPFICVPINLEWAGHVDGVIDRLAWEDAWGGSDEEKERAVNEARKLLVALKGGMCMFKLRQNAIDDCLLEQSFDNGETWVPAFDFALCLAPVNQAIYNVTNVQGEQTIINNYNDYEASPSTYAPNIEADDDFTNTAYCHALDLFVRGVVEGALTRKREGNKKEAIYFSVLSVISVATTILTGGTMTILITGITTALSLIINGIFDAIEEGTILDVLEDDDKIAELVCCAYNDIKNTRLDQPAFSLLWATPCDHMSSNVIELLPIFQAAVQSLATFIGFLDSASNMWEYADQGLIDNNCLVDCVPPGCEPTPAPGQTVPDPIIEYISGNRWKITATKYSANNRYYSQTAIPCGSLIQNISISIQATSPGSSSMLLCDEVTRINTGILVGAWVDALTANEGDLIRLELGAQGGNSVGYTMEFDLICPEA